MKLELWVAAPFLLVGVYTAIQSLREPVVLEDGGSRFLVAVHEAAKAAFWLTLGGFFVAYGLVEEPANVRWLALVPILMGALRLGAAALLARR